MMSFLDKPSITSMYSPSLVPAVKETILAFPFFTTKTCGALEDPNKAFLGIESAFIVFEFCKKEGIPVAWNLAGGYQSDFQKVLDGHSNTMKECIRIYND